MPLTITLHNFRPHYTGGSTIQGTIKYTSSTPTDFQDIRVTFAGTSKSKISKSKGTGAPAATYRAKCTLFEKERILVTANGANLAPGQYEYPFEFSFPESVQEGGRKWVEKTPYRSDANQPLPPSFAFTGGNEERKVNCAIEYKIEAQVSKPQRSLFSSRGPLFREEVKFNFLPEHARSDGQEDAAVYRQSKDQLFNIRSALLLPENRGRSLSVQEKIQGWLIPSQLPRFSFTASFSYPTRVIQGAPLNCSLEITPHMEDSSVVNTPEILLQSISIYVIGQTAARAAPSIMGALFAEIDDKMEILSKTSLRMPMSLSGRIDLGDVFGPLALCHTDVSLRTFNIARTYRLCASMVFECAGKTGEFKVSGEEFQVFSSVIGSEKKGFGLEMPLPEEDAPPVYEDSPPLSTRSFDVI
ncbi:hypothetical protein BDV06DRAFT_230385 [Aspergillus oleicola]